MPDYAEVNTSPYAMTSFHGSCRGYDGSGGSCSGSGNSGSCNSGSSGNSGGQDNNNSSNASDAASAAPYASTTLVVRARPNPNGSAMVSCGCEVRAVSCGCELAGLGKYCRGKQSRYRNNSPARAGSRARRSKYYLLLFF